MIQILKCSKVFAAIPFIAFILLGCNDFSKDKDKPLVLATYAYSTNDRIENLRPLSIALEKVLHRSVKIKSYPDVDTFIKGINTNEVDVGFINTLGYLLLYLHPTKMDPIATLKVQDNALDNYKSIILTNHMDLSDSIALREEAERLTITFVARGSTSGNLMPRLFLSSIGIQSPEKEFKAVNYGGNHTTTLNALKNGETDICAIGSNEYYNQIKTDSMLLQKTRVLWMSNEIPLGPVMLKKTISNSERKIITDVLENLHKNNPIAFDAIKAGWSEAKQVNRFYAISDEYYDHFRRLNGNGTKLSNILDFFMEQ